MQQGFDEQWESLTLHATRRMLVDDHFPVEIVGSFEEKCIKVASDVAGGFIICNIVAYHAKLENNFRHRYLNARLVLKVSQGEKEAWNGDAKQKPLAKVLPFKPVQSPPQSLEQREAMLANLKELTQIMKQKAGMDARAGMKNYPTMNDRNHQETMAYLESIRYLPMQS